MPREWPPDTRYTRVALSPDWGNRWSLWSQIGSLRPTAINLSPELAVRLRGWTLVWQIDLDPVETVNWSDPEQ